MTGQRTENKSAPRRPHDLARAVRVPQQARCWCGRDALAFEADGSPLCALHADAELIAP